MDIALGLLIFFLKIVILVIAILITIGGILAITGKQRPQQKGKLQIKHLNKHFTDVADTLRDAVLNKKALKENNKQQKKAKKKQQTQPPKQRLFVLEFEGDMKASGVNALREEVTAILSIATPEDEVIIKLTSPGGVVHGYGLAASQLTRLKDHNIPLTVAIDTVAASGGYMMACVADKIIAAPFAIIGSIGVVMQMPNFHRWLKKHHIDYEQLTAGEHKRTLTLFGENNDQGRQKMQSELDDVHVLFKDFIRHNRPQVSIDSIATGEHWFAKRAIDRQLVDDLQTSDSYLFDRREMADIYHVSYQIKRGVLEKLSHKATALFANATSLN